MSKPNETNGTPDAAQLTEELERLRAELAKVKRENEANRKLVQKYLPFDETPPPFTKEEALAWVGKEMPLEDFIAELEREMMK